jgi:hypothetical protein
MTAFLTILGQNRYNCSQMQYFMKIHRLLSSLQNGLTKRSSSYTICFQMKCWMTLCLNHDYLILIFIHFPYLLYENPSFIIVSAETDYSDCFWKAVCYISVYIIYIWYIIFSYKWHFEFQSVKQESVVLLCIQQTSFIGCEILWHQ